MITPDIARQIVYTGWLSNADKQTVRRAREMAYEHMNYKQVAATICEVSKMIHAQQAARK